MPENLIELPVADLKPWDRNARTHSKKQVRQIADSITVFGFTNPILVDRDNTILAGHGRVAAAQLLGMERVKSKRNDQDSKTNEVMAHASAAISRYPALCPGRHLSACENGDLGRGNHQGQRSGAPRKQAGHKTASDKTPIT